MPDETLEQYAASVLGTVGSATTGPMFIEANKNHLLLISMHKINCMVENAVLNKLTPYFKDVIVVPEGTSFTIITTEPTE